MTGVLSLAAAREEREPDPDCVHELADGRRMYLFTAVYQHADDDEELYLWAFDLLDAERRVLSISLTLVVVGQVERFSV